MANVEPNGGKNLVFINIDIGNETERINPAMHNLLNFLFCSDIEPPSYAIKCEYYSINM